MLAGGSRVEQLSGWSEGTGVQKHTAHACEWWCVVACGGAAPRAVACGGAACRAAACGGAAPRAAAPAGYGPRPMLFTGPAQPWPGLEGMALSAPAASAAGRYPSLTAGRPLSLAAVDRGSRPRLLTAQGVRTEFPLYAAAPLGTASNRELGTALRAPHGECPASPAARPGNAKLVKLSSRWPVSSPPRERGAVSGTA